MIRVLVVHHDQDVADEQVDTLRRAGYEVAQCAGPIHGPCPVIAGRACVAVDDAAVLVYDVWATGESDGSRVLVEHLREQHPEIPVVLTAPGLELDWVHTAGIHSVVPLVGQPSGPALTEAVKAALDSVGGAAPA